MEARKSKSLIQLPDLMRMYKCITNMIFIDIVSLKLFFKCTIY